MTEQMMWDKKTYIMMEFNNFMNQTPEEHLEIPNPYASLTITLYPFVPKYYYLLKHSQFLGVVTFPDTE